MQSVAPAIAINVSPIFAPLKTVAYLNIDEEEAISFQPFEELITEQMKKNLPYILALVQDEGSSNTFCFDAYNLDVWNKKKSTNPTTNNKISNIFLFALKQYTRTLTDCFEYLGTLKEVDLINPNLNLMKKCCFAVKKHYIKIDVQTLFAPLQTSSFLDINQIEPSRKICFLKLINEQKKKKTSLYFSGHAT